MKKNVIITGITGQDGAYLAKFLVKKKKFNIFGIAKKRSVKNLNNINYLGIKKSINLIFFDLQDHKKIKFLIKKLKPVFFFNFGAQSSSFDSFDNVAYTDYINNTSVIYILEAIKNYSPTTKFIQACSSEMFGDFRNFTGKKINENLRFNPSSPYAISKASSYYYTRMYRNNNNMFTSNVIFFNHESPLRGNQYLTKKIIRGLLDFKKYGNHFYLGNLYSKRDWGDAKDYVEITYKIILSKKPNDYIISTGKNYSVKDFVNIACKHLRISIKWIGKGLNEKGVSLNNKTVVAIKKNLFRDYDLNYPISDCSKAKKNLGWKPKKIDNLIKRLINFEINSRS
jgi:GDPmannose 4,6-dehydratase